MTVKSSWEHRMNKTLLASAIALAFAGSAWGNPTNNNTDGDWNH